jgi:lysophospholipase L1-like esterase
VIAGVLTTPTAAVALDANPVMVALGDSITRAPLADGPTAGTGVNSWATGTTASVESHRARLSELSGSPVTAYNVAVNGSTSSDLPRQAALAVSYGAEYVTILSGANNVCDATSVSTLPSVEAYKADVRETLTTLAEGLPDVRILLGSVPSLQAVYDAGRTSPGAILSWATFGTCPIMMSDPLSLSPTAVARRSAVDTRIREMNASLASVCRTIPVCTYDEGAVYHNEPTLADLSPVDHFHPSLAGQAKISEVTWARAIEAGLFEEQPEQPAAPSPGSAATAGTHENGSPLIALSGSWATLSNDWDSGGSIGFASSGAATATIAFTGTSISWISRKSATSGINEVYLDGVLVAEVDRFSTTTRLAQQVWTSGTLEQGRHTLKLVRTDARNPASTGGTLVVDAFVVK